MATALRRLTQEISEERASLLAQEALSLFQAGEAEKASRKLREAAALGHDNADVQGAFLELHSGDSHTPLVDLCRRYAQYHDAGAGDSAVTYLRGPDAGEIGSAAIECLKLVLESRASTLSSAQDVIISELARHSKAVRLYFASELNSSTTEFFDNVYERGDHAANCLRTVVLDPKLWASEEIRLRVEDDLFQLFLAKLMESGHDHDGRALKGIALLLLADTQRLHYFIDEDAAEALLSSLDFRLPPDVRGQATLVYARFLETSEIVAQTYFVQFTNKHVQRQKGEDLIMAFSAATALFPVAPNIVAQLFLAEGLLPSMMTALQQRFSSTIVHDSFLVLANAACIDSACRKAINQNCATWLSHLISNGEGKQPAMAATILAKLRTSDIKGTEQRANMADQDVSDLVDLFQKTLTTNAEDSISDSVEGLAYTSLRPEVKESLAKDQAFLNSLLAALVSNPAHPEILVGGLSVISNLTHYQPSLSEEQKRVSQLKAYANASRPHDISPLEDDDHVQARCVAVVEAGTVPVLVKLDKTTSSATAHLTDTILLSLSRTVKDRGKIAQQGAVRILVAHALKTLQPPSSAHPKSLLAQKHLAQGKEHPPHDAAHALARILISLNPSLVFPANGTPHITDAVVALATLLKAPPQETPSLSESAPRDLLPVFEALLALTNLASSPDPSASSSIIRSCFDETEELLLHNNHLLRRAATELICNLVAYPAGAVKFAEGSRRSKERLKILVAMADVEDLKTRLAAGGGLAMITDHEPIASSLLDDDQQAKRTIEVVLDLVADSDAGLVHRGLAVVMNLICTDAPVGSKAVDLVKAAGGEEHIKDACRRIRDPGILSIGVDILKKLQR